MIAETKTTCRKNVFELSNICPHVKEHINELSSLTKAVVAPILVGSGACLRCCNFIGNNDEIVYCKEEEK